ncbi:hypothetical protein KFK09_015712 [Dendrobium nobile]|uniref:Mitochondrial glycoprotein n=1 Tax=Dendrobium nobile TaxID=94219 RepID=A0A8T3B7M9_DENNO|nr:hypothetical protein KFK09_015712 [Dendrobium nobile]
MARLLSLARRSLSLKSLSRIPPSIFSSSRSYISEMRRSAFKENLLRILRTEITYESEYRPPLPPATSFDSFSVEDNMGEQWIRLRRKYGDAEEIKIDATMFDGASPPKQAAADGGEEEPRLHISLIVEVSKGEASDFVLQFVCSAWSDSLDVEKVFPVSRGSPAIRPFMGPNFKELDDELQDAIRSYLEERGVNDDLAEFLHEYMANKDKLEFIRWMRNVESYVKK